MAFCLFMALGMGVLGQAFGEVQHHGERFSFFQAQSH